MSAVSRTDDLALISGSAHPRLAEEIAGSGAVISEFPINMEPRRENFPRRNRIISGLSKGVLVVEAARNSGALITADFALEQGREVFSLPGKIDSRNSTGTNYLIKQGAKLVSSVEDIIEELDVQPPDKQQADISKNNTDIELDNEEKVVYNSLSREPLTLDEICQTSGANITEVLTALFRLEMKRAVRQLPGKRFLKN